MHDIFRVDVALEVELLLRCFALEPTFLEVIESLKELNKEREVKAQARAKCRTESD